MIATLFLSVAASLTLAYAPEYPKTGIGDVVLPKAVSADTPAALVIHGGGWKAGAKSGMRGLAEFLANDLGYAVYNIDYRLSGWENPWPACGEDCLRAGKYMFSDAFAAKTGVRPKSILVIGGSAGGHLALWTGLKLGAKCDRIVSISGIADPEVDYPAHPGMYRGLFGKKEVTREMRDSMSVMKLIRPHGPKILLTHATEDKVVPIATAKSFLSAYRAAGNDIGLFEYPSYIQPGLTGHCTWIPGSKPHKLIPRLEREITYFLRPTPVPEPVSVRTSYELSAHYYAGTEHAAEWGTVERPIIGPRLVVDYADGLVSAPVVADGEWREYAINLDHNVLWSGDVNELWLQATELYQALVDIDWMRFEPSK